ncbi:DUF4129 domain-containing protein [Nocardia aurantia]|uniref:Protein-glutamine gamma-glutamyltransferase-like C-terminal domain-containing protein n=1 Tax=Nocardia aurantia TaxID=2585199 RepID=A0A7K0DFH3_9NOCA|nr:DUF4129 domain-containing protein [Nocardia aurantia]MQY24543.1 hypothetical protein [Nocardia aurantia]
MGGARLVVSRAAGLLTLVALVVVALRGFVPGTGGPRVGSPPSMVGFALMPVLSLVSVVILLAGVLTSEHRLPLAMPVQQRRDDPIRWRRAGTALLVLVAFVAMTGAAAWAAAVLHGHRGDTARPATPSTAAAPDTAAPPATPLPFSGTPRADDRALVWIGVTAAVLIGVALVGLVAVASGTRQRVEAHTTAALPDRGEPEVSLVQVAELGLAAILASGDQDARTAIIACYGAMESGLAQARGVAPLISDTPSEVLARAFDRGALRDASARELVTLFEEARFSPHAMLEWQRLLAEQLLRIVLRDLRADPA